MKQIKLERRVAAPSILAALLACALFYGGTETARLNAARLEREATADLAARLARPLPQRLAETRSAAATGDGNPFVTADTETLAAAEIDRLVRTTAADAKGAVLSSRTSVEPEANAETRRIKVEAVMEGRIEVIQRTLFDLETRVPLVLVDDLVVQPADRGTGAPDVPAAPLLQANVTLTAFWRGEP